MRYLLLLTVFLGFLLGGVAKADGSITVTDAKSRPTAPGGAGVVYMTVTSTADDTLTAVSTPAADKAEMHRTMKADGGVMTMDAVSSLPLKANVATKFGPGGLHVMLMGLKKPLAAGDSFPLTLTFANAQPVTVTVSVQSMKAAPSPMKDMPGMKM